MSISSSPTAAAILSRVEHLNGRIRHANQVEQYLKGVIRQAEEKVAQIQKARQVLVNQLHAMEVATEKR